MRGDIQNGYIRITNMSKLYEIVPESNRQRIWLAKKEGVCVWNSIDSELPI